MTENETDSEFSDSDSEIETTQKEINSIQEDLENQENVKNQLNQSNSENLENEGNQENLLNENISLENVSPNETVNNEILKHPAIKRKIQENKEDDLFLKRICLREPDNLNYLVNELDLKKTLPNISSGLMSNAEVDEFLKQVPKEKLEEMTRRISALKSLMETSKGKDAIIFDFIYELSNELKPFLENYFNEDVVKGLDEIILLLKSLLQNNTSLTMLLHKVDSMSAEEQFAIIQENRKNVVTVQITIKIITKLILTLLKSLSSS